MRGKEYSEDGEGMGDKYTDEYFEELKYANQWRPQSAHSSNAKSSHSNSTKTQSMDALFYEKEIDTEIKEDNVILSVKNDTQNEIDPSVRSGIQSSKSGTKVPDPRRRSSTGNKNKIFIFELFYEYSESKFRNDQRWRV